MSLVLETSVPGPWAAFASSQPQFCRGCRWGGIKYPQAEKQLISTQGRWCDRNQSTAQLLPPKTEHSPALTPLSLAGAAGGSQEGEEEEVEEEEDEEVQKEEEEEEGAGLAAASLNTNSLLSAGLPAATAPFLHRGQTPAAAEPLRPARGRPRPLRSVPLALPPPLPPRARSPHRHGEGQEAARQGRAGSAERPAAQLPRPPVLQEMRQQRRCQESPAPPREGAVEPRWGLDRLVPAWFPIPLLLLWPALRITLLGVPLPPFSSPASLASRLCAGRAELLPKGQRLARVRFGDALLTAGFLCSVFTLLGIACSDPICKAQLALGVREHRTGSNVTCRVKQYFKLHT